MERKTLKHALREEFCINCKYWGMADNNWCKHKDHQPEPDTCSLFEYDENPSTWAKHPGNKMSATEIIDSFMKLGN